MTKFRLKSLRKVSITPIGIIVKNIRIQKKYSLYRLSKETKIPYSTLKSMEDAGKTANFDYIVEIAKILNEPLESFTKERRIVIDEQTNPT